MLLQQGSPAIVLFERLSVADDNESVLRPSNAHIDAIEFLHKAAWACAHHRHEDYVKFSSLRAVYRKDLVTDVYLGEPLSDLVLLRIIWCDHIYAVLGEFLDRKPIILLLRQYTAVEAL